MPGTVGLWLSGTLDTAALFNRSSDVIYVFSRLESAGRFSTILRNLEIAMEQANAILATPAMEEGEGLEKAASCDIELSHVSFGYDDRQILEDVSLSIPAGTSCAIVGPSGSGKTTLVRLIERFWDVNAGQVTLGGRRCTRL